MGVRVRDRVRRFDEGVFEKFVKTLQLSMMDGNLIKAHHLVDKFAAAFTRVAQPVLELGDSVAQLVDPETAGLLQGAGYHNISSVLYASDAELLGIRMFGHGRLTKTREALVAHKFAKGNSKGAVLTAC